MKIVADENLQKDLNLNMSEYKAFKPRNTKKKSLDSEKDLEPKEWAMEIKTELLIRDLGDGLILRRASVEDADALADNDPIRWGE